MDLAGEDDEAAGGLVQYLAAMFADWQCYPSNGRFSLARLQRLPDARWVCQMWPTFQGTLLKCGHSQLSAMVIRAHFSR